MRPNYLENVGHFLKKSVSQKFMSLSSFSPYFVKYYLTNFLFQRVAAANDRVRVEQYKARAQAVVGTFKRLDLVLTIEFSSSPDVLPLVVEITNLPTALGLC